MTADPNIGRVLGSYRLASVIAEGGMSTIYRGQHTRLPRAAAIKVLKPALQQQPAAVARFLEETRTLHRIHHPNIVEPVDLVEDGAYCVLELLDGPSLERRLADGRIPLASVVRIATQIADALAAVHAQGIVHRDLKPQNVILLARAGRADFVKLIDFGVAQLGPADTSRGATFGTAAYMAPEQAAGDPVDARADLYALGVILFEMATGRHPFPAASDSESTLRHADEVPPVPSRLDPAIPRALDAIIARCLAKRPAARFADAVSLAAALRALDAPGPRRRRAPLVVAGAAALVVAGGVALAIRPDATPPPPPTPPPPVIVASPKPPRDTVTLTFVSTPPRARVYRPGETIALGVTPFTTTLRAGTATPVRFELAGYDVVEVEASLAGDGTIEVALVRTNPRTPRPTPSPPAKKLPLQREGVLDPFAR